MGAGRTRAIRISGGNRADGYANEALGASSRGENVTSTTSNTRLTKIDETLSDRKKNEDNDLDVFELLPSDRTISSAFSALLAAEFFFFQIFFTKYLTWNEVRMHPDGSIADHVPLRSGHVFHDPPDDQVVASLRSSMCQVLH